MAAVDSEQADEAEQADEREQAEVDPARQAVTARERVAGDDADDAPADEPELQAETASDDAPEGDAQSDQMQPDDAADDEPATRPTPLRHRRKHKPSRPPRRSQRQNQRPMPPTRMQRRPNRRQLPQESAAVTDEQAQSASRGRPATGPRAPDRAGDARRRRDELRATVGDADRDRTARVRAARHDDPCHPDGAPPKRLTPRRRARATIAA